MVKATLKPPRKSVQAGGAALSLVERFDVRANAWSQSVPLAQPRSGCAAAIYIYIYVSLSLSIHIYIYIIHTYV